MAQSTPSAPIRQGSAIALVATEAIGVGIFMAPAMMIRSLGSPAYVFAVWALLGVMAWLGAWCYGRLATRYPVSGGGYVYLREIFGPQAAFLFGWMSFWVMDPGVLAALAAGMAGYAAYLFPMAPLMRHVLAAILPAAFGLPWMLNPAAAQHIFKLINALKLLLIVSLPVYILFSGLGRWSHFLPLWRPSPLPSLLGWGNSLVVGFFAMAGWWEVVKVAALVRSPGKTLPRALSRGVWLVAGVYGLLTVGFILLVPLRQIVPDASFLAQVGAVLAGAWGARLLSLLVLICVAGALGALLLTTPQVYLAMQGDGLFPAALARRGRRGWPVRITLIQVILAAILAASGAFAGIAAYAVFSAVLFLVWTVAGALRLPVNCRGARAIPLAFMLLSVLVLVPLLVHYRHALGGVLIVLLGWPVGRYLAARRNSAAPLRADGVEFVAGGEWADQI